MGLLDSINIVTPIRCIYTSSAVRDSTLRCIAVNGVFFLLPVLVFPRYIVPLFIDIIQPESNNDMSGPTSAFDDSIETQALALIVSVLWNTLYVAPIYVLSQCLNMDDCQKIADGALQHWNEPRRRAQIRRGWLDAVKQNLADTLYGQILQYVLLGQITVLGKVPLPWIGPGITFTYTAWLMALYCFEYTWIYRQWSFETRLDYFENHWAYFIGYGTPLALIKYSLDSFLVSAAAFQLMFPLFLLIAIKAEPITCTYLPTRLPVCREARIVTDRIVGGMRKQLTNRINEAS